MIVVVAVGAVLALRRVAERVDRLLTDQHSSRSIRVPDSAPAASADTSAVGATASAPASGTGPDTSAREPATAGRATRDAG